MCLPMMYKNPPRINILFRFKLKYYVLERSRYFFTENRKKSDIDEYILKEKKIKPWHI